VAPCSVEGPDGEFAPRPGARLVAVDRRQPRHQLWKMKWRGAGVRDHPRRRAGEMGQRHSDKTVARAPDTNEIDLRLRHRLRKLADLCMSGWRHLARQGIDLGGRRGI